MSEPDGGLVGFRAALDAIARVSVRGDETPLHEALRDLLASTEAAVSRLLQTTAAPVGSVVSVQRDDVAALLAALVLASSHLRDDA